MHKRPVAVAFDVVETLFSLDPVRERLVDAGLPRSILPFWFATFIRDAFALDATGIYKPFKEVAAASLEVLLTSHDVDASKETIARIVGAFAELPAHPDVRPAFEKLRAAGVRIAALSNGAAKTTNALLERAHLDTLVEATISIDEVLRWKPAREVYLHAAKRLDLAPPQVALVAAHAWDVLGASQAGLMTGFVARHEKVPSAAMARPDCRGASLVEVVEQLLG